MDLAALEDRSIAEDVAQGFADPALPIAPQSIALAGTVAWLIDDTAGWYFDFSGINPTSTLTLRTGGTFADIAGGATVIDANGAQYIVGATRLTGSPTDKVLKVDPTDGSNSAYPYGNTTWITLSAPRLGAGAAWTSNYGLVVAGGSNTAAGVEYVKGTATGTALNQFPPDPTFGAGAAALEGLTCWSWAAERAVPGSGRARP